MVVVVVVCSKIQLVGVFAIAAAAGLDVLRGRPGDGVGAMGDLLRRRMFGVIVVVDVKGGAALGLVDDGSIFCLFARSLVSIS